MIDLRDLGAIPGQDCTFALDVAVRLGGPHIIHVPAAPEPYVLSAPVALAPGVTIQGDGPTASRFSVTHGGDAFTMTSPLNASTAVNCAISGAGITCSAPSTGAAIHDVGGTYWRIEDVQTSGFAYGVRLCQTECADVIRLRAENATTAAVWLENEGWYTNLIRLQSCSLTAGGPGRIGVLDDGGACHTVADCNIEGFAAGIQVAFSNLIVLGGDVECADHGVVMTETNSTGLTGGPVTRVAIANASIGAQGSPVVGCPYGRLSLTNVAFSTAVTNAPCAISGAGSLAALHSVNSHFFGPMALCDTEATICYSFGDGA
jgi:hypothetical protein